MTYDLRLAVVARWRNYGLQHVACGYVDPAELASGRATLTFGDGSWIEITDPEDVILAEGIKPEAIDE